MHPSISKAFDELHFGDKILNLRESLPTAEEAVFETESWLLSQQSDRSEDVLVITGRGNNSPGGVSKVKTAVEQLLRTMGKGGVVKKWKEHTAGSFAVTLSPKTKRKLPKPFPKKPR